MHRIEAFLNDPQMVKWLAVVLIIAGTFLSSGLMISDPEGTPRRMHARYVLFLDRKLRAMFIWTPGEHIALAQMAAVFAVLALHFWVKVPYWYLWLLVVVVGPAGYIELLRRRRVTKIEEQLDGLILAVANALKSTPSIGDAFISVQRVLQSPIREEVELAIKEMRLGSTLDQALLSMASRIGSRSVDAALAAVLIGRQVGGNLPKILETTAGALREMQRLEGVVRTKTAEGRAQLWVMALFPFFILYAFDKLSPGYFEPLTESFLGYSCAAVSLVLWASAILWARTILNVDI